MTAFTLAGQQDDLSPWDALLLAVKRRAARVRWVDTVLDEIMAAHRKRCEVDGEGDPEIPPGIALDWMEQSRREETLMTRSAKLAIDAGVADAMIRRYELEGALLTDAMIAGLDSLDLTQDQRMKALSVMHRNFSVLPAGSREKSPDLPGIAGVIDVDPVNDDLNDTG